jgi:hypothetical protein
MLLIKLDSLSSLFYLSLPLAAPFASSVICSIGFCFAFSGAGACSRSQSLIVEHRIASNEVDVDRPGRAFALLVDDDLILSGVTAFAISRSVDQRDVVSVSFAVA